MTNEEKIWDRLLELIRNPYGVAGVMGNLQAESGLEPCCLERKYRDRFGLSSRDYANAVDRGERNFLDNAGWGLAQWTVSEHKEQLLSFAQVKDVSIADLDMQIDFLRLDLQKNSSVLNVLRFAGSVEEASNDVLLRYERPADTSDSMKKKRAAMGQEIYERNITEEWRERMNGKPERVIQSAKSRLGDPYVYGARGPHQYDCRGFTYCCLMDVGIRIEGAGATSQWNDDSNWIEKGTTDDMPDLVCCVFKKVEDKMSHTGLHIGNSRLIHCSGGGVQYGNLDPTWTHWAVPLGLYTAGEIAEAGRIRAVSVLKRGSKGEAVRELQEQLKKLGYDPGEIDGVYGTKTVTAVKSFQADHDLNVDGAAGAMTQAAIREALQGKPADQDPDPGTVPGDDIAGEIAALAPILWELKGLMENVAGKIGELFESGE